jgi:hypothetical protein
LRARSAPLARLLVFVPVAASAQTALERIEPRLAKAIAEHRVFLSCSDGKEKESIEDAWRTQVAESRAALAARYTSLADLAAFDKRTAAEALELPADMPKARREMFCNLENKGWIERYYQLNFVWKIDDSPL